MKISTPQRSLVQMAGNINLMKYSIRSKGLHRNCNQWWKHVNWNYLSKGAIFLLFSTTIFIVLWPFVIWSELFTTKYIQKRYWCSWSESTPCDTKKEKSTPYGFKYWLVGSTPWGYLFMPYGLLCKEKMNSILYPPSLWKL